MSISWLFKKLGFTLTCARHKLSPPMQGISLRCHTMRPQCSLEKLEDLRTTKFYSFKTGIESVSYSAPLCKVVLSSGKGNKSQDYPKRRLSPFFPSATIPSIPFPLQVLAFVLLVSEDDWEMNQFKNKPSAGLVLAWIGFLIWFIMQPTWLMVSVSRFTVVVSAFCDLH